MQKVVTNLNMKGQNKNSAHWVYLLCKWNWNLGVQCPRCWEITWCVTSRKWPLHGACKHQSEDCTSWHFLLSQSMQVPWLTGIQDNVAWGQVAWKLLNDRPNTHSKHPFQPMSWAPPMSWTPRRDWRCMIRRGPHPGITIKQGGSQDQLNLKILIWNLWEWFRISVF